MGLVDYDSGSDSDQETDSLNSKATQATTTTTKKPFQKLISGGKIQVSLPTSSTLEEPSSKRPRLEQTNTFAGFNSFLPPPKNRVQMKTPSNGSLSSASSGSGRSRVGINLKTGASPAFSRGGDSEEKVKGPEIPEGMKNEEEVELKGNPLMFKPLSVVRQQQNRAKAKVDNAKRILKRNAEKEKVEAEKEKVDKERVEEAEEEEAPKSLFSFVPETRTVSEEDSTAYKTIFPQPTAAPETSLPSSLDPLPPSQSNSSTTLGGLADDLNLDRSARRDLLGRNANDVANANLVSFNMDREYAHNEHIRATTGDDAVHNPLRTIQPGKHSLKQLVTQAQNNREALEESFAAGKSKRKEAGGKYGW